MLPCYICYHDKYGLMNSDDTVRYNEIFLYVEIFYSLFHEICHCGYFLKYLLLSDLFFKTYFFTNV